MKDKVGRLSRAEQETKIVFNKEHTEVPFSTNEKRFMRTVKRKKLRELTHENSRGDREYKLPFKALRILLLKAR